MKQKKSAKKIKARSMLCMVVGGALLLQSPTTACAAADEEFSLDQIVITANRMPTELLKTAANVTVITQEDIEKGAYGNLGDVLRDVNGVIVPTKGFAANNQAILLNGDDRVLIMIDGRRVGRPEGTANGSSSLDLSTIVSLGNIERIEIVKGGASALYGSDAVGGVVNIITRKGVENKTTLELGTGSWGLRNYKLSVQRQENDYRVFITADKKSQDYSEYNVLNPASTSGSNKGDTYRWPNNSEFEGQGLTVRVDKEIDSDRSLTLNLEHWSDKGGQPFDLVDTYQPSVTTHLSNNAAFTYNFDQSTAVPGFARIYSNYHNQNDLIYGANKSRVYGGQYQTGWQVDEANQLIAGVEWTRGTVLESASGYNNKSITNTGVYLQDVYSASDKLTITPGIRYDHHSNFGGQTTPKLSANYSVNPTTDIYVSYNRVFKAPTLDDLYAYSKPGTDGTYSWGASFGNPNLEPEKGQVISAGINKKLGNNTTLKTSYFASKITNAIDWDNPSDLDGDGLDDYQVLNIDKQKKRGIEVDLHHRFSPLYYTEIGYSYVHVENNDNGTGYVVETANSQPKGYRVKLGYTGEQWNVNLNGQGVSGRNTTRFVDSSYWIWNMAVNYKINENANVYLNAFNITDKAYELISSGTSGTYNGIGNYPMAARNFQLGIRYSF
ncbi:TonB-dependent receptor [Sporomusa sp.]|uniref:TonB-dependent receptor plug domain-containing protein n=1 Tax=Sporomusa sp. TaxID=2078658 RepID=UPI002BFF1559|nr:TonB-dependent receptor [Sporomusa sp.]HWR05572.1 TonB-dependent receptor [Sporomusa sp.]